jgi:glyoxylase-like metal-dependent hydrolase (beta-lactamase superfamily II)
VALLLTHAHPDHIGGLASGALCPVYADAATMERIDAFPLPRRRLITPREPFYVAGIRLETIALQHSPRASAVGYRIQAGRNIVFYCPDVAAIPECRRPLSGIQLHIGNGASYRQSLLHWEDDMLYGHAPLLDQLRW